MFIVFDFLALLQGVILLRCLQNDAEFQYLTGTALHC